MRGGGVRPRVPSWDRTKLRDVGLHGPKTQDDRSAGAGGGQKDEIRKRASDRSGRKERTDEVDGRVGASDGTSECGVAPGQTLKNPITGERFTFLETAATTDGELLAFDFALRPGGMVPFPHVHPVQEERFEVVAGRVCFREGCRTFAARGHQQIWFA